MALTAVSGFTFSTTTPNQCGQWTVTWCVHLILSCLNKADRFAGAAVRHPISSYSSPYVTSTETIILLMLDIDYHGQFWTYTKYINPNNCEWELYVPIERACRTGIYRYDV
jgi:hypothetical protein